MNKEIQELIDENKEKLKNNAENNLKNKNFIGSKDKLLFIKDPILPDFFHRHFSTTNHNIANKSIPLIDGCSIRRKREEDPENFQYLGSFENIKSKY